MKPFAYQSATQLVEALASKKISSVELLDETIARIEQIDQTINAIPVRDFDRARLAAQAADAAIAKDTKLALLGLPMSVKESFDVQGLSTSWGNPVFKDWQPDEDAVAVKRLKAAGAVIIGKSNVPFMLGDWQTYNDLYGVTNNPWHTNYTPGGSSGGSAAALAAGLVALELGSDLAGSLRTPAHFCGIYAHKPSLELVPLRGASPPGMPRLPSRVDLAAGGPMARYAEDLALGLAVLAGPDEWTEGKGYTLTLPPARHRKLADYRVLIIDSHPLCPTSSAISLALDHLAERLAKAGTKIARQAEDMPDLAQIASTYALFLGAFSAGTLPMEVYNQFESYAGQLPANDMSLDANYVRGVTTPHRDWLIASKQREWWRHAWRQLYKTYDVVICPVMPTTAFLHDHSDLNSRQLDVDGVRVSYTAQSCWPGIANFFGLPATAAPIDRDEKGLPIGIQIIGDYLEDNTTIEFARLLAQAFGGFEAPAIF